MKWDFSALVTPCYVVDKPKLKQNLTLLRQIRQAAGCRILLAQKAFSMFSLYPMIGEYLDGAASSSLFEARLAFEEMGKEVHVYAPAYREEEFDSLLTYCDHIVFNSFSQWEKFKKKALSADHPVSCGLRINPEYSEIETKLYDPCAPYSRLGVPLSAFNEHSLDGLDGLHFHTMCEQNSDVLARTGKIVDQKFGRYLSSMKWLNFGGGHHITREDYDVDMLYRCIRFFQEKYGLTVYLEPGEAVALNAGYLVSTVLDVLENGMPLAILDTSAACHMPDVLEMPYRPNVINAGKPKEYPYTYRLGGPTCLAGDIIGDYSFKAPLHPGDKVVFCDMAIYTMVKNNTFNGIPLPAIATADENGKAEIIRQFDYTDFKSRLS